MDIKEIIGQNIKARRTELQLSQEQLAHEANIDRTYLQSIEKGKRNVSIDVLLRLSNALDVQLTTLLSN